MFSLILSILHLKKDANSLHLFVETSSGPNCEGGLVNFSTVEKRTLALFIFLLMMLEKKDCLALHVSKLYLRSISLCI